MPSPAARRSLVVGLQAAFVVAALWFAGSRLAGQWTEAQGALRQLTPRPLPILAATVIVLATYALLVQLWRLVLVRWGARLSFTDAVHVWSVANLGRWVPGRVAQVAAMAYMSQARGVSGTAAAGSALLNTLLNIAAGTLVALAAGGRLLDRMRPGASTAALALVAAALLGMLALPWLLPRAVALAARLLRRPGVVPPVIPPAAIWWTAAGNVVAWLLYGAAFQLFTFGVLGQASGALSAYVAVYTASYIIGYLVVVMPGGLVARELALGLGMVAFGLATEPQAAVVAVTSRLWLTVLEVVPGLLFLARSAARRRSPLTPGDAPH